MNPYLRVLDALNRHNVRYVVVGGFAAAMHGSNRITVDLDLVVDLEPAEARRAVEAMLFAGFQSRLAVDPFLFADPVQREAWIQQKNMLVFSFFDPTAPGRVVDLFVRAPVEFDQLFARAKTVALKGLTIRVCSVQDLINMKSASGRPVDLADVETLRIIQSRTADSDDRQR